MIQNLQALKTCVHRRFVADADAVRSSRLPRAALSEEVQALTARVTQEEDASLTGRQRELLVEAVLDEIVGLGPLEQLLRDDETTEIMVNGPHSVFVERQGRLLPADVSFEDDAHLLRIIERILAPLGRRVDEASPICDARLADGSRVNIILPPLAVHGPALTIRKFARSPYRIDTLVHFGTLTPAAAQFLRACVFCRLNVLVSGGTGSGKTTTLNALSGFIPPDERIVTIEDAAELQLQQPHVVTLESRPPNLEGRGEVTIRHLVRNALRMRPDRIILGEVRGAETLDLLAALNTGHDGSLSTVHANAPRECLARLETLAMMAGTEMPLRAIREQISSGLQIIVHQQRLRDGSRRVTHIAEILGMEGEAVALQDLFRWEARGVDAAGKVLGELKPTGLSPTCLSAFESQGVTLPSSLFCR